MKARDTVMNDEQINAVYIEYRKQNNLDPKEYVDHIDLDRADLKAQAEISFKAGYKQGVKDRVLGLTLNKFKQLTKLKEWGVGD